MKLTISLNGADNVGKTTQIGLLPRGYNISIIGSLHDCDEKMGQMVRNGSLGEWWWICSDEEFVCTIYGALGRRYWNSLMNEQTDIAVFDRGTAMFDAVTVAVLAVKSEDHNILLLKHEGRLEDAVQKTLDREEKPTDDRYRLYQTLLQSELQCQEEDEAYRCVIVTGELGTHREVQDKIRAFIASQTNDRRFAPMLHNLSRIYAFGGLSEAGKSSLAESLCAHYGSRRAFRSKFVFFNDEASERLGKSVYTLPEKEQALLLVHELDKFSRCHYWLKVITIESLHRDTVTFWLKTWLGDKLRIVFVDTSEERRLQRSLVPHTALISNDTTKQGRGAELIRRRADLILDNNGSFELSVKKLIFFSEDMELE